MQKDMVSTLAAPSGASIDTIRTLANASFVMTGSRASASVNVWTAALGLNFAGGFNFREQYYRQQASNQLYNETLALVFDD